MWAASDVIGSVTATVDFTEEMLAIEQILFLDLGEKNPPVLHFKVVLEKVWRTKFLQRKMIQFPLAP